jgi:hypothetical protein
LVFVVLPVVAAMRCAKEMQPIHVRTWLMQDDPLVGFVYIYLPSSFPKNADCLLHRHTSLSGKHLSLLRRDHNRHQSLEATKAMQYICPQLCQLTHQCHGKMLFLSAIKVQFVP